MREKIEKRLEAIRKSVGEHGRSDGSEIAKAEEMRWLVEQTALDGIMLHVRAAPEVCCTSNNECYYYYTAISVHEEKDRVREFVNSHPLMPISMLNKLLRTIGASEADERAAENIKAIRRLIQARDQRRRRRMRKAERRIAELEEMTRIEEERAEAADNRNNLDWLVSRIEELGYEVLLRKKEKDVNIT